MPQFTVQHDDEYYRILGPSGEEGEIADIGSPAFLTLGGLTYMAFLDMDPDLEEGDAPDPHSQTDPITPHVFLLGPRQATQFVETQFEGPGLHEVEDEGEPVTGDGSDDDADDDEDDEEVEVTEKENKGE